MSFSEKWDVRHYDRSTVCDIFRTDARISALQAHLAETIRDSKLEEPAEITDRQTSVNVNEQRCCLSRPQRISTAPSPAVSNAASKYDDENDPSDAERNGGGEDGTLGLNVLIRDDIPTSISPMKPMVLNSMKRLQPQPQLANKVQDLANKVCKCVYACDDANRGLDRGSLSMKFRTLKISLQSIPPSD